MARRTAARMLVLGLAGLLAPIVAAAPARADVLCDGQVATIVGTDLNETITGTNGPDVIAAAGGADTVNAMGGDDVVCGGDGADDLHGGSGNDSIFGEAGADKVYGDVGDDELTVGDGASGFTGQYSYGGNGDDTITASPTANDADYLHPGQGSDTIAVGPGFELLYGEFHKGATATWDLPASTATDGTDVDTWTGSVDEYIGTDRNDVFHLGSVVTEIFAGKGNDVVDDIDSSGATIRLDDGDDLAVITGATPRGLQGKDGIDTIDFRPRSTGLQVLPGQYLGFEIAYGSAFDDNILSQDFPGGIATVYAGPGNDTVNVGASTVYGDDGNDTITGSCGPSLLRGGSGDDTIYGASASCTSANDTDTIRGDSGLDHLYGLYGPDNIGAKDGQPGDYVDGGELNGPGDICVGDVGDTILRCEGP